MITRRAIIISLAVNFSLFWALSLLCWMGRYGTNAIIMIWLAPTAPLFYGFRFLAYSDLYAAFVSLIISALAIGLCVLAVRNRRILILITAHIAFVIYWLWNFLLILFSLRHMRSHLI